MDVTVFMTRDLSSRRDCVKKPDSQNHGYNCDDPDREVRFGNVGQTICAKEVSVRSLKPGSPIGKDDLFVACRGAPCVDDVGALLLRQRRLSVVRSRERTGTFPGRRIRRRFRGGRRCNRIFADSEAHHATSTPLESHRRMAP